MKDLLPSVRLGHVAAKRRKGDAALRVLSARDFSEARAEITTWEGYAPTPLFALSALSSQLGLDAHSRVLLIGSEGVTDPTIFNSIMEGRNAA